MFLNPLVEYDNILKWLKPNVGSTTLTKTFVNKLSRYLNTAGHPIKCRAYPNIKDLDFGDFTIGAEYSPDNDEQGKKPFLLNFLINYPRSTRWEITDKIVYHLALELVEVLTHEYQHLEQYRARKFKILNHNYPSKLSLSTERREEQNYLSNPDEIDAYAMNIAVRYYIQEMRVNTNKGKVSNDLKAYRRAFGKNHKIVKQLETMIEQNLIKIREMQNGKNRKKFHRIRVGSSR